MTAAVLPAVCATLSRPRATAAARIELTDRSFEASWEDLLARIANQDRAAFETLFGSAFPLVRGVALRHLRNAALADEVAQEVFAAIWSDAERFDPLRSGASGWLCRLARCRSIDRVRSLQAARRRDERFHLESGCGDSDAVWEHMLLRADHDEVRQALASLTPLQHQTVTLMFFDGLTAAQVASELSISLSTIKTRLRDALLRLRRTLAQAA